MQCMCNVCVGAHMQRPKKGIIFQLYLIHLRLGLFLNTDPMFSEKDKGPEILVSLLLSVLGFQVCMYHACILCEF